MAVLVVAAAIHRSLDPEKKVLIVRRGPGQSGAGIWEFPGGKIEPGESPEQALVREIEEELAVHVRVQSLVGEVEHQYPGKLIRLRVYRAELGPGEILLSEHDGLQWLKPEDISLELLSEADRPFVSKLRSGE